MLVTRPFLTCHGIFTRRLHGAVRSLPRLLADAVNIVGVDIVYLGCVILFLLLSLALVKGCAALERKK